MATYHVSSGQTLLRQSAKGSTGDLTAVVNGGIATNAVLNGGTYVVSAIQSGATLDQDAHETIEAGGIADSLTASDSSDITVNEGGSISGLLLQTSASILVDGGHVSGAVLKAGGGARVEFGGAIANTYISSGGRVFVAAGTSGGNEAAGGGAVSTTVAAGGYFEVQAGGLAVSTTLLDGTALVLDASGYADDSGAVLNNDSLGAGYIHGATIENGGTMDIVAGTPLRVLSLSQADGVVLQSGGTIQLDDLTYSGGAPTLDAATDTLTVTEGSSSYTIGMAGDYSGISFNARGVGAQTFITDTGDPVMACFAEGTRIATARGLVAIERLRAGDAVVTHAGAVRPVVWLGHRRVSCRRHPRKADVQPIRIGAHAFGLGRPQRDVLLSPDHAVFAEGVLIPVRYLLNDATVRQDDVESVAYWHVELDAHDVLLAEGLPAESFLDTGNRAAFANGGTMVQADPHFARDVWTRAGCAPLVTAGPVRDLVYRRLLAQALALGWRAEAANEGATTWVAPEVAVATR
jgi:autotransporter passenger strand-loop-strand repeat protein